MSTNIDELPRPSADPIIALENVSMEFDGQRVLRDLNL